MLSAAKSLNEIQEERFTMEETKIMVLGFFRHCADFDHF
jgi:hypothetical protein